MEVRVLLLLQPSKYSDAITGNVLFGTGGAVKATRGKEVAPVMKQRGPTGKWVSAGLGSRLSTFRIGGVISTPLPIILLSLASPSRHLD